jgi:hypothetical protein
LVIITIGYISYFTLAVVTILIDNSAAHARIARVLEPGIVVGLTVSMAPRCWANVNTVAWMQVFSVGKRFPTTCTRSPCPLAKLPKPAANLTSP